MTSVEFLLKCSKEAHHIFSAEIAAASFTRWSTIIYSIIYHRLPCFPGLLSGQFFSEFLL